MADGKKNDAGKLRYSLLPSKAIASVVRVLTFGAEKYGAENWRLVEGAKDRYTSALLRHVEQWRQGEWSDEESGLPHLAHATCCALFLLELEMEKTNQLLIEPGRSYTLVLKNSGTQQVKPAQELQGKQKRQGPPKRS